MRYLLFFLAGIIGVTSFAQQMRPFSITGKIASVPYKVDKVYVYYRLAGEPKERFDSSDLVNGKYELKGMINEPVFSFLTVRLLDDKGQKVKWDSDRDVFHLFLEPGKMTANSIDSFANATVTGSASHIAYTEYGPVHYLAIDKIDQVADRLRAARIQNDTVLIKQGQKEIDSLKDAYLRQILGRIKKAPASPIYLYAINQYFKQFAGQNLASDAGKIEQLLNALHPDLKNYPSAVWVKKQIAIGKKIGIGAYAINFSQADTSGKQISLSSFRGKYVLLDFWGSWCGPCRKENPTLIKAFDEFNDKGFTILSVSLELKEEKQKWFNAIRQDKLERWTHVSDLQYWDNAAAKMYGITSVPQNYLINPEGKIIATNLRGDNLLKKLREVLN